jgi:hypothetical protein
MVVWGGVNKGVMVCGGGTGNWGGGVRCRWDGDDISFDCNSCGGRSKVCTIQMARARRLSYGDHHRR